VPTILNPADSKREKMLPITFFATAFGLMMEKVRSIAMITSSNKILYSKYFERQEGGKRENPDELT
jgi:hypothetical protein